MRGGRPTTTSRPSHILLIFSSEPPRNPRPYSIFFKCLTLLKMIFLKIWQSYGKIKVQNFLKQILDLLKKINIINIQCAIQKKHLYQWEGRASRGGSDEKMWRMWLGREIIVADRPPLG